MQCDFSKSELIDLDFALIDRFVEAERALQRGEGNSEKLQATIQQLDILHYKLLELIEQAEQEA